MVFLCLGNMIIDLLLICRLAVIFLALDVFFMIFCVGMACIICLALFCCIPVVAIAYAMTIREGASEDEIRQLPKYRFHQSHASRMSANTDAVDELALQFEDSVSGSAYSYFILYMIIYFKHEIFSIFFSKNSSLGHQHQAY